MTRKLLLTALMILTACRGGGGNVTTDTSRSVAAQAEPQANAETQSQPVVIDSALTIDESLRRFRTGLPPADTFANAARSRDDLVRRFVSALEKRDTAALAAMTITRSEFAYLYYPESQFSKPPYDLDPQTMWMQTSLRGGAGFGRLMRRYAGTRIGAVHLECLPDMKQGRVVLTPRCQMHWKDDAGQPVVAELFGSIILRDGRYKFISYANKVDA